MDYSKFKSGTNTRYTGAVRWFNEAKGYGFISPDAQPDLDIFVHFTNIRGRTGTRERINLYDGQRVSFMVDIRKQTSKLFAQDVVVESAN